MISVIRRLVSDDGLSEVGHAGEHAAPWPAERERASPAFGVTRHRCADSRGSEGWSIYGAKRAQPVATGRKCDGPDSGSNGSSRSPVTGSAGSCHVWRSRHSPLSEREGVDPTGDEPWRFHELSTLDRRANEIGEQSSPQPG